ncbi:MAG TPA: cation transporter, partial [Alphaproteobacteria bacterium]|nr:cation transporter [Alphaproteobacteria bacterium]
MSVNCSDHCEIENPNLNKSYRRIVWICLVANTVMFFVQIIASYIAGSVSLLANSLDFLSDSVNYGISIFVLDKVLRVKAKASIFKGVSLGLVGLWTAFETVHHGLETNIPKADIMAYISVIALIVNVICAVLLYRFRKGDSNTKSVWLCSRNDAIGNIAVMVAALGVFSLDSAYPDIIVATILALLALSASWQIL